MRNLTTDIAEHPTNPGSERHPAVPLCGVRRCNEHDPAAAGHRSDGGALCGRDALVREYTVIPTLALTAPPALHPSLSL